MKKSVVLLSTLLIFLPVQAGLFNKFLKKKEFGSLNDLVCYSNSVQELPPIDNKDYEKPDYTTFYQSQTPNFLKKSWKSVRALWAKNRSIKWSPDVLKDLLKERVEARKNNLKDGPFLTKFSPEDGSQIVTWANLFGSYHSLVRSLQELEKRKVIDNSLSITNPDYYFVFNGNMIDLAPFSMETLTTVLLLMKKNPDRVFYVKGAHESKQYWATNGLRAELQGKIKKTKDFVELEKLIDKFFKTLPSALYIRKKHGFISQFVEFSNDGITPDVHNQNGFRSFLYSPDYGKPHVFKMMSLTPSTTASAVPIDLYVRGDNGFHDLEKEKGLRREKGVSRAPIWSQFSAQNRTHRQTRKFYHDSFAIFSLKETLRKSTFSLCTRDTRTKEGFKTFRRRVFG